MTSVRVCLCLMAGATAVKQVHLQVLDHTIDCRPGEEFNVIVTVYKLNYIISHKTKLISKNTTKMGTKH